MFNAVGRFAETCLMFSSPPCAAKDRFGGPDSSMPMARMGWLAASDSKTTESWVCNLWAFSLALRPLATKVLLPVHSRQRDKQPQH